jgi:hypothetical protein
MAVGVERWRAHHHGYSSPNSFSGSIRSIRAKARIRSIFTSIGYVNALPSHQRRHLRPRGEKRNPVTYSTYPQQERVMLPLCFA